MGSKGKIPMIDVTLGFAADAQGQGVAYARLRAKGRERLERVPFAVRRYPALLDREIAYGAATAVAKRLGDMGVKRVRLRVGDERLVSDLREHPDLPLPLSIEYVRLGCALNRFAEYCFEPDADGTADLEGRARAEVALHIAA